MRKFVLILLIICIGIFFLWTGFLWKIFSCNIAGSYACSETWSENISQTELIEIVNMLKKEHPELEPPNAGYPTSGKHDYWYNFLFHYKDTNEDVDVWAREEDDPSRTTIGLSAIIPHIDSLTDVRTIKTERMEINRDYGYFENKKAIRKFRNTILNLIEEKIKEHHEK